MISFVTVWRIWIVRSRNGKIICSWLSSFKEYGLNCLLFPTCWKGLIIQTLLDEFRCFENMDRCSSEKAETVAVLVSFWKAIKNPILLLGHSCGLCSCDQVKITFILGSSVRLLVMCFRDENAIVREVLCTKCWTWILGFVFLLSCDTTLDHLVHRVQLQQPHRDVGPGRS